MSVVVGFAFGDESLHGGYEFVGGAEVGDFVDVIFEGDVGVAFQSACGVGVDPD